jgi:enoyl-CoA hydratase
MSDPAPARDRIYVEREDRVQIWRIDYPPHNYMTSVMVRELAALVEEAAGDDGTGAVVITGARPGVYVTHDDEREIVATSAGQGTATPDLHDLFHRMKEVGKVFITAINGPATGGGCELALACDLRYMAEDADRIGLPGMAPGTGGTQRLPKLIGEGRALEMMLEGRTLAPEEALAVGLVNKVVTAGRLLDVAIDAGERLSRRPPTSVEALKRSVYQGAA